METNLGATAPQPGRSAARIWLIVAYVLFVIYAAGLFIATFFPGAFRIYGVGLGEVTLEGMFIHIGFITIYGILVTLPMLMIVGYQRSQMATLKEKIRQDLWLCGLDGKQLSSKMQAFSDRNSWGAFILPAVLTMIFLAVMWSFFLMPAGQSGLTNSLSGLSSGLDSSNTTPLDVPSDELYVPNLVAMTQFIANSTSVVMMTFLGAYFYILSILIRRWLQADLTTGVLWKINVRLAVALLVGFLLSRAAPEGDAGQVTLLVIGFLAGIVPDTVLRWLTQQARRIVTPRDESKGGLFMPSDLQENVDGLNFWQIDRLFEEGIESVQDLAMKEIPDLLINTRFDTPQVLYWVDQALLSNQVGERGQLFQGAFIKTASDLSSLAGENNQGLQKVLDAIHDGQGSGPEMQGADEPDDGAYTMTLPLLENIVAVLRNGPNLLYTREYWSNTSSPERRAQKLAELEKILQTETN
jgi:hypothetical protein